MKLRIVSDGTTYGTKVVDERGERIEGVTFVGWTIKAGASATAVLHLRGVGADVAGDRVEP